MHVQLTDQQQRLLAQQAAANGFASVEQYAADLLGLYAAGPAYAGDPAALQRSAEALDRSHEQAIAGESRDMHEALQSIADRHGVKIDR